MWTIQVESVMQFTSRAEAGRQLADRLEQYRGSDAVVLGIANGGVPVAAEIARHLGSGLDVIVVRRFGFGEDPDSALGAVTEGGSRSIRWDVARERGLRPVDTAELAEPALREVERRVALFRGGRALPALAGRTVVLVDDAIATGTTARAAGAAVRRGGAARVVLAAPVVAALVEPQLHAMFDDVAALERPLRVDLGTCYRPPTRVSDDEVLACLRGAPRDELVQDAWEEEWFGVAGE